MKNLFKLFVLGLFFFVVFADFGFAVDRSVRETPVVGVVRDNGASVVNISTESVVFLRESPFYGGYGSDFDLFFDSFFGRSRTHTLKLNSVGSGVVIDKSGLVVTNSHVINMASNIFVILNDGTKLEAEVVFEDRANDLAIVRVGSDVLLKEVKFADQDDIMIGETAVAIGNPLGFENSVTVGIVSGKNREFYAARGNPMMEGLLQTDAPINPGNSGGALFNLAGELIGINVAVVQNSQSIGFAIPVDKVISLKDEYGHRKDIKLRDKKLKSETKRQPLQRRIQQRPLNIFDEMEGFFDGRFGVDGFMGVPDLVFDESANEYTISLDLEGIDKDSIDINANKYQLRVSGKHSEKIERKEQGTVFKSESFGRFVKTVPLPEDADTANMSTKLEQDKLVIKIPKK